MNGRNWKWLPLIGLLAWIHVLVAAEPTAWTFRYTLEQTSPRTSAGVYDAKGRLVRVLWTLEPRAAGEHVGRWNGMDDLGQPVPDPQGCQARVAANPGEYRNLGVIGNTGVPANTFGHVPVNFESIAVAPDGSLFTTHDWDEPHHDVIRWSASTGQVHSHSGHPIGALCKALAVDDQFAYVTIYAGSLRERDKVKFTIARLRIDPAEGSKNWPAVAFTVAGPRIVVYDGNAQFPDGVSDIDRQTMLMPLLSLAVRGDKLYVTDALGGKVRMFDKTSGEPRGEVDVPLAQAIAIDAGGRLWVGHGHANVSVFDPNGTRLATPITNLAMVKALAFGPDGSLHVADRGAGQVRVYAVADTAVTLQTIIGQKAQPGDRATDRFYHLAGVALDAGGNLYTLQNEHFFNGGRMARFNPDGAVAWEQMGLEFSSTGNYDPSDPDLLYTQPHHTYRINRDDGTWTYLGNSYDGTPYRTGPGASGSLRFLNRDGRRFAVIPGTSMRVYEVLPGDEQRGPVFKLVSILGGPGLMPDGSTTNEVWKKEYRYLWSWVDEQGDHAPQPEEVRIWSDPEEGLELWQFGAVTVDARGDAWYVSAGRGSGPKSDPAKNNAVWRVPLEFSSARGNPHYDWSRAHQAIAPESLHWPMGFKMAQHDVETGVTYSYGLTRREGTPKPGGVWMAGNALAAFRDGVCLWQVTLPDICVGLDAIPGGAGGCIIGGNPWKGVLHHYTAQGLLVGTVGPDLQVMGSAPNNPSGLLDMFSAVSVNRDPRDGVIDAFVEDNYNLRIAWHRIDDRALVVQQCALSPDQSGQ